MTTHTRHQPFKAAFTITELVVTVLIIGVLVLIMTPVLTQQAGEAKVNAAMQDMQNIADVLDRAFIDTSYFYRLDVLNDGVGGDGEANTAPDNRREGIRDNEITQDNYYAGSGSLTPEDIFIDVGNQGFPPNQAALWERLSTNETQFGWRGPYINWHRDGNNNDWPDDPWGNDYLLFTLNGVIYAPIIGANGQVDTTKFDIQQWIFQDEGPPHEVSNTSGAGTTERRFDAANIFDRPTLLSLGPNGLPGDGTSNPNDEYGKGDDLTYQFAGGR